MSSEPPPAAGEKGTDAAEAADSPDDKEDVGPDHPQDAWSARRDLNDHMPRQLQAGGGFGGGQVRGDQYGISGGYTAGDVLVGSTKTEINYRFAVGSSSAVAGEVPVETLDRLERSFVCEKARFDQLADQLRHDRFLVLVGPAFSGRRTAALMLLRHLGAAPLRILDRSTSLTGLADQLKDPEEVPQGLLLCDPDHGEQPLREPHLLAAREALVAKNAFLIVTMGPTTRLADVPMETWKPPTPDAVLAAHLRARTDEETTRRLLTHPAAARIVADDAHQLREIAAFAAALVRHQHGECDGADLSKFDRKLLEDQVREWFEEDEETVPLREKAFLIALAVFDGGPYALTAELSDKLYQRLQKTQNSSFQPRVPVFGTHIGKRLQLARATLYTEEENTEWGPVKQTKAAFRNAGAPLVLLREVWTGHPSARPALVGWLQGLVGDGRPLVRTRAASTTAALARVDLPSAMALIIEKWASSKVFRQRIAAANTLVLAHALKTPNIPRILDDWCDREDEGLCWTAIRALALIGPDRPGPSLAALRKAARKLRQSDEEKARTRDRARPGERDREHQSGPAEDDDGFPLPHLTLDEPATRSDDGSRQRIFRALEEAVELLLLSTTRETVLAEVIRTWESDEAVRDMTLGGFLIACVHTVDQKSDQQDTEEFAPPAILDWYAASPTAGPGIATLWRGALSSRKHTKKALGQLRQWVLIADRSPAVEHTLGLLLPALAVTTTEHRRLSHLLRTMPGEDGASPPRVAHRLLATLDAEHRLVQGVRHG